MRRDFLSMAAGAVAAKTVLPIGTEAAAVAPVPAQHRDAKLLRVCAKHVVNLQNYNCDVGVVPLGEFDPLWIKYTGTRDFISAVKPKTLAGMQVKARAAKAEALGIDGVDSPECTPAAVWAWDLVNDLLAVREG